MITRTFYESQGKAIYNIRSTSNFQEFSATPEAKPEQNAPEDQYRIRRQV
jgi:hypothetical protein